MILQINYLFIQSSRFLRFYLPSLLLLSYNSLQSRSDTTFSCIDLYWERSFLPSEFIQECETIARFAYPSQDLIKAIEIELDWNYSRAA